MTLYRVRGRLRGNPVDALREMNAQEARDTRRRMSYAGFSSVRVVPVSASFRARAHDRAIRLGLLTASEADALLYEAERNDYERQHPKPVGGY